MSETKELKRENSIWDESIEEGFFGVGQEQTVLEQVVQEDDEIIQTEDTPDEKQPGNNSTEKKDLEKPGVEEEEEFFKKENPLEPETENSIDNTEKDSVKLVKQLKDRGLLDFEIEEGQELSEEEAEELLETMHEEAVENRLEELFENLPQDVKALNKFVLNGGTLSEFLSSIKPSVISFSSDFDIDNEENQEIVLREDLKNQNYDDDYIETFIDTLKDSGKLKASASKIYNKLKQDADKKQELILAKQREQRELIALKRKEHRKTISELVASKDLEVQLSKKEQKDLPDYISNFNIKLENGSQITQMQLDLHKIMQDPKKVIVLAKLLKDDLKFDNLKKQIETKVTKETKEKIVEGSQRVFSNSGSSQQNKLLSDYF